MSGFRGSMKEYKSVSIDRFDKNNLHSTVYFLSHCHRDHMIGMEQASFARRLKSGEGIYLYCSAVTKLLLLSESAFSHLSTFIRVLEVGVPTTVPIPDTVCKEYRSVVVTCLPASHCPGSVMFLFEGKEGTALYTGDFRWEQNYATTLPALCVDGQVKPIDSMYVDTTFCVPEAFFIPSRDDCLTATATLVSAWLQRSSHHFVHISSRSKYGHEPLLAHLARETGTRIHTCKAKVSVYEEISELRGVFTSDPQVRIHACPWQQHQGDNSEGPQLPCGYTPTFHDNHSTASFTRFAKVMVIRPSTMWFTAEPSRLQELVVAPASGRGIHRVCYSFHSSYSELRDLVSLMRPTRVFPNVLPASDSSWDQVTARLQSFLTYHHKQHLSPAGEGTASRPLGMLKRKRTSSVQNLSDSEGLVFDSPDKLKLPCKVSRQNDCQPASQGAHSDIISPSKSVASDAHSSYQGSDNESEADLFDSGEGQATPVKNMPHTDSNGQGETTPTQKSGSLRSYISGDEEMEEEDRISSFTFCQVSPHHTGGDSDTDRNVTHLSASNSPHNTCDPGGDTDTDRNVTHLSASNSPHNTCDPGGDSDTDRNVTHLSASNSPHNTCDPGGDTDTDRNVTHLSASNSPHNTCDPGGDSDTDRNVTHLSASNSPHNTCDPGGDSDTDRNISFVPVPVPATSQVLFNSHHSRVQLDLSAHPETASSMEHCESDSQDIIVIHSSQSSTEEVQSKGVTGQSSGTSTVKCQVQSAVNPHQSRPCLSLCGKQNLPGTVTSVRVFRSGSSAGNQAGDNSLALNPVHQASRDCENSSEPHPSVILIDDFSSTPPDDVTGHGHRISSLHHQACDITSRHGKGLQKTADDETEHCVVEKQHGEADSYDSDATLPPDSPVVLSQHSYNMAACNTSHHGAKTLQTSSRRNGKHGVGIIDLTEDDNSL